MVWHTHHCGDSVSEGGRDGKEGGREEVRQQEERWERELEQNRASAMTGGKRKRSAVV